MENDDKMVFTSSYYLVQYGHADDTIVHAIVHRTEIFWPMGDLRVHQKVLLKDELSHRLATVLYMDERKDKVRFELKKLKAVCFERFSEDFKLGTKVNSSSTRRDSWLLVQYSKTPSSVAYVIAKEPSVLCSSPNREEIFSYLIHKNAIRRAIVLARSVNRRDLIYKLRSIRLHYLEPVQIPLSDCIQNIAERTYHHQSALQNISNRLDLLNQIDEQQAVKHEGLFYAVQCMRIIYRTVMDRLHLKIRRELDLLSLNPQIAKVFTRLY